MTDPEKALREAHAFCGCICTDKVTGDDLRSDHECGDGRCDLSCCGEAHAAINHAFLAVWDAAELWADHNAGLRMDGEPEMPRPDWLPKEESK